MNQLQSIYNNPFKDSHSDSIHIGFPIIATKNVEFFSVLPFFRGPFVPVKQMGSVVFPFKTNIIVLTFFRN